MLPSGLGDLGRDGGCSRGRAGAARFAPVWDLGNVTWLICRERDGHFQ